MARRVFFHIGAPKSGTTYLQDTMWKNKQRLAEQGILLPARRGANFHATLSIREDPRIHKRNPSALTAWTRILDDTRRWDDTVIISHEFFGGASADQAKRALDDLAPAEVDLVFTARDYLRLLPAAWQEWVKIRYGRSLTEFIHDDAGGGPHSEWGWRTCDVVAILDRWGCHLPPERVHVVTVPQAGAPPQVLWSRFAGVCGIDPDSCNTDEARHNLSLGRVEVELMRRIGPKVGDPITGAGEVTRWVRDMLAHQVLAPRRGQRFGLSPADAKFLRERSRQAAEALDAAGYDIVGDLSELIPPADLPELPHPDGVTDSELLDVAVETIVEMLHHVREQNVRGNREKQRADHAERALARARLGAQQSANESRPIRRILIDLSERYPVVMKARVGYSRAVSRVQRFRSDP